MSLKNIGEFRSRILAADHENMAIFTIHIFLFPYSSYAEKNTYGPQDYLVTTLYFETVARLLQGGGKAVTMALSQPCIIKL